MKFKGKIRKKVSKGKHTRKKFNKSVGKTKAANIKGPMRGGYRF